jgi:uncharacterized protein (DUF1330 family)
MSAYLIVDIDIQDAAGLEEYRRQVPATITKYGGRFIVRGGQFEKLEGNWQPKRSVLLEFPSVGQAKRWCDSEEYRPLKAMRLKASNSNLIRSRAPSCRGLSAPPAEGNQIGRIALPRPQLRIGMGKRKSEQGPLWIPDSHARAAGVAGPPVLPAAE